MHELLTRVVAPVTGALPVYITENGSSWYDYQTQDGRIEDYERESYLRDAPWQRCTRRSPTG